MKMFTFDPAGYRDQYRDQGWVHIREGISPEFHEYLLAYVEKELNAHLLQDFAISGKKEQALFEFPSDADQPEELDELFDSIAELCDLNRETMVLSERHIQAYEPGAAPEPIAHKDRFPSQVSIGLSITIPDDSRLVLYPYSHNETNPFSKAADLNAYLQPEERPENVLPGAREVELADRDRDVVIFPGSTTWHLRRRSARSVNVYFKLNDFGVDPLGEDPTTEQVRAQTLAAMGTRDADGLVVALSRRLDTVARVFTRNGWQEVLQARIYGEEAFGITEFQFDVLRAVDGRRTLAELNAEVTGGRDAGEVRTAVLLLAERGVLDLLPVGAAVRL